jgi:hypothetical protein
MTAMPNGRTEDGGSLQAWPSGAAAGNAESTSGFERRPPQGVHRRFFHPVIALTRRDLRGTARAGSFAIELTIDEKTKTSAIH